MEYKVYEVKSAQELEDLLMDGWIVQGSFQLNDKTHFILMRNVPDSEK